MLDLIHKLRAILTRRERRQFVWLLVVIAFMGLFEMAGIAAIMPFMQLVAQPDAIESSRWLQAAYDQFGFTSERSFLFAMGVFVLVLLTVANTFTVFTLWLQQRFTYSSSHSIANRLLQKYLRQSYTFFLQQNSAALSKQVLAEANDLATNVQLSITVLVAKSFVALVIFTLLVLVDPTLAITMFSVFGTVYALIYYNTRRYLSRLGKKRFNANEVRYRAANEAISGIKLLKISGREPHFLARFSKASHEYTRVEPKRQVAFMAPVYFVQTLAFGSILVLILYLLAAGRDLQEAIPLLALYALAGYRLLPSLSQIFKALSDIRYRRPALDSIYQDLLGIEPEQEQAAVDETESLSFNQYIQVKNLSFRYQEAGDDALKHINLTIHKGQSIAFVGPTGSGKTTLVDILVGLLDPRLGGVYVDDVAVTSANARQWQSRIGYVPQEVVLYDDTVTRNIAFGMADEEIDFDRVKTVAALANIHEFITAELDEGYNTIIGERGVRLSGGQRQRLGLARALYHDPEVLVLDEATSALDGLTEEAVMQGIAKTGRDITIIMIAHRLVTVKNCDRIYLMEQGQIIAKGTYQDLIENNSTFRGMAKVSVAA